ncbi:MAG TPA: nucleotide disphospho-sugar-binding domain-containing protein [Candidatus Dormibacteraeota bacterium]|nr:nucleotide disphospho-sugar-binding domain-containing protein [Candidatus Dormibacteraeota bacterium]
MGREVALIGDQATANVARGLGIESESLPGDLDLGPFLAGAIRQAMVEAGGDHARAGALVDARLSEWSRRMAAALADRLAGRDAALIVTSLFGIEVLHRLAPDTPWAVINSTFYVGPNPPRPLEQDFGPRAVALIGGFVPLLAEARLVLHATDQHFDYGFAGLPPTHLYSGPLGVWEPPQAVPPYLSEPGDPWVLVSISTEAQDDVPIARAALEALADRPVRVLVTVGPEHDPAELGELPANARAVHTAPHGHVLERAVVFVSHAGHGSVMKGLWYGCPMVLAPWGRDQPGVAARAQALGVARIVPRDAVSAGAMREALGHALADKAMAAAAQAHSLRLRATDPPAVAAAALEGAAAR